MKYSIINLSRSNSEVPTVATYTNGLDRCLLSDYWTWCRNGRALPLYETRDGIARLRNSLNSLLSFPVSNKRWWCAAVDAVLPFASSCGWRIDSIAFRTEVRHLALFLTDLLALGSDLFLPSDFLVEFLQSRLEPDSSVLSSSLLCLPSSSPNSSTIAPATAEATSSISRPSRITSHSLRPLPRPLRVCLSSALTAAL